jgi:hypothetical protein
MFRIEMDDEHLRDFYAGLAMLGVLSAGHEPAYVEAVSRTAFDIAERMMEERSQRSGQKNGGDGQSV